MRGGSAFTGGSCPRRLFVHRGPCPGCSCPWVMCVRGRLSLRPSLCGAAGALLHEAKRGAVQPEVLEQVHRVQERPARRAEVAQWWLRARRCSSCWRWRGAGGGCACVGAGGGSRGSAAALGSGAVGAGAASKSVLSARISMFSGSTPGAPGTLSPSTCGSKSVSSSSVSSKSVVPNSSETSREPTVGPMPTYPVVIISSVQN